MSHWPALEQGAEGVFERQTVRLMIGPHHGIAPGPIDVPDDGQRDAPRGRAVREGRRALWRRRRERGAPRGSGGGTAQERAGGESPARHEAVGEWRSQVVGEDLGGAVPGVAGAENNRLAPVGNGGGG